ncbi:unnamed protein product, partial [Discosporangium mesarthrocarpum]
MSADDASVKETPSSSPDVVQVAKGGPAGTGGPVNEEPTQSLEGKSLLSALKMQVEFYFSRQNLQTDGFLVSQMNAQMCVPVSVIAQFPKIQALTTDPTIIKDSVKDSSVCTVTPDGIKPNIKQERNTIILREIPSNTPQEKVRELFTGDGIAQIKSIRSDVGDTWFVTMDSEDDALSTILALRGKAFDGKPIKARLKSENILRSFFPVPTASEVQPTAAAAAGAAGPYGMGPAGMPGMPYGMPNMGPAMINGPPPAYGYPAQGARGMYGGRGGSPGAALGPGYPGPFVQWKQDEILNLVSKLSREDVANIPGVEDVEAHTIVFDREPNMGLLLRQRSVSIDECREQLRKGRPVHREGVIAGDVDYGSYMYGEGHDQQQGQGQGQGQGHGHG